MGSWEWFWNLPDSDASAGELADDLRRKSDGEPIEARPVGRGERAVKWVRRNPALAASTVVLMLALMIGTAVSTVFVVRAERRAEAEAIA